MVSGILKIVGTFRVSSGMENQALIRTKTKNLSSGNNKTIMNHLVDALKQLHYLNFEYTHTRMCHGISGFSRTQIRRNLFIWAPLWVSGIFGPNKVKISRSVGLRAGKSARLRIPQSNSQTEQCLPLSKSFLLVILKTNFANGSMVIVYLFCTCIKICLVLCTMCFLPVCVLCFIYVNVWLITHNILSYYGIWLWFRNYEENKMERKSTIARVDNVIDDNANKRRHSM